jgi:Terminase large subunit, T4likevirus-type, N-terminal
VTIIQAIKDPALFRPLFRSLDTWRSWMTVLKAIFALPMNQAERVQFTQLTVRETPPTVQVQECWLVVGRRGGKSFIVALIAVFLACFRDYSSYLGPGETGVIMIIANDKKQARVIHRYARALLNAVPMLAAMITRQDNECIDLNNHVSIEITTASYRTIRGFTVLAALCDEIAFWRSDDSANPAEEILAALRPAMSTIPNALLIGLGTPYKRSGPLYAAHKRYFGVESPVLVVQAPTRTMNPNVSQSIIDTAFERDPVNASAEYMAEFRSDVGSFLDSDSIERAIEVGRQERPPQGDVKYFAFCDPSGGAHDAMTLGIAHRVTYRAPRSRQEELDQAQ